MEIIKNLDSNTIPIAIITAKINKEIYTAPNNISMDSNIGYIKDQSRADIMMETLIPFFSLPHNFEILKEWLVKTETDINKKSRSIIEWFLINYSKQYDVVYDILRGKTLTKFFVSIEYVATLDCYKKEYFDMYCRKSGSVIELEYDDKKLKTSVAQLNLFRWCIRNCVFDYINNHYDEIYNDQQRRRYSNKIEKKSISSTGIEIETETVKTDNTNNTNSTKGKKRQLSKAYGKTLGIHSNINLSMSFDVPTNSISCFDTNSSNEEPKMSTTYNLSTVKI